MPSHDLGLGTKRGIEQQNASGQVGTVTLFAEGAQTVVDVAMHGVPPGKTERASVVRASDCDRIAAAPLAYRLHDLAGARSRTLVGASLARLVSGNCGHLFH